MKRLMYEIKMDAKKRKITGGTLSRVLKVTSGMVSNYYSNTHEITGFKFIQLIDYVYQDNPEIKLVKLNAYIGKVTKVESLQELLEWSSNSSRGIFMDLILERLSHFGELEKDLEVYRLLNQRREGGISKLDFFVSVEELKEDQKLLETTKALLKVASLYSSLDMNNIDSLPDKAKWTFHNLRIDESYNKDSLTVRIKEVIAASSFRLGDIDQTLRYCNKIIEDENSFSFPFPLITAYSFKAEAMAFTNYPKSLESINTAIKKYNEIKNISPYPAKEKLLRSTHDFIKIHNKDYDNLYLDDNSEKAHFYAMTGEEEKCIEILDTYKTLSGHQYYYKWRATGDNKYKELAMEQFLSAGNRFYLTLLR